MADTGFTYVGKHILSNLIKLMPVDFEDLKRFWGFEDELNQLRQSLVALADIVEDAEEKQHTVVDARFWLRNLKEVAYEAADLLSELGYETIRLQIQNQEVHRVSSMSRAMDFVRKAKFRLKMALKLKKVNQSLQKFQMDSLSLQLSSIQHNLDNLLSQKRFLTDSIIENSFVGRKADVAQIVNLLPSSCYQQLTLVSITGTHGIGKTTLAKLVCQKVMALTRKPFDVKIWVCVAANYAEHKVLGEMLRSLNASMGGLTNEDAVLRQLKKELAGKKFLLVLDDVWNDDHRWWDLLKTMFSRICTNNGNAILVTTAFEEEASIMATSSHHSLQLSSLSRDECWFILKERAFRNVITPVPSNLEAIGREIANRCGGVPLMANFLGGIMGFDRDEEAWLKITDYFVLMILRGDLDYLSMVKFIFLHLPSYLHSCLAFCSIFPRDFLIRKEDMIWLWMAEGIVDSYDMGNKCFDALLASSLFQDAEKDDYNDVISCKMHKFLHNRVFYLCGLDTFNR